MANDPLHLFGATDDPITIEAHLREHGFAIVNELVNPEALDALGEEAQPYIEATPVGRDSYDGYHTRRTGALIARCPTSRRLVMDPLVVAVVTRFLSHATTIQLHLTQIISVEPGETRQKLHRDQMAFDGYPFPSDYHVQCNTMWALSEFNSDNGATHILPGSSIISDEQAALLVEVRAEMRRGSVLFYDGKVLHGAGANTSTTVRQGVNITYSVGWVRQEENQFLACPPDIARTLDDELLQMMGYRQGAFALGYVGDQRDPLAALRGTNEMAGLVSEFADKNSSIRQFVDELAGEHRQSSTKPPD